MSTKTNQTRRPGCKKVDSFRFEFQGYVKDFDIYMKKQENPPLSSTRSFWVFADDLELSVNDVSIDAVERKAVQELQKRLSVKWEMFLKVHTHGASNYRPGESLITKQLTSSLEIEVELVELGTHHDGSKVHRLVRHSSTDNAPPAEVFREPIRMGWPLTGEIGDEWINQRHGQTVSLIPFTEEKYQQVLMLLERLSGLRNALKEALSPTAIERSLVEFNLTPHALMAPASENGTGRLIESAIKEVE